MSFEDTVQKIASSPLKRQLFRTVPAYLYKEAATLPPPGGGATPGFFARLLGDARNARPKDMPTGGQEVLRHIAGNVGAGATMAGAGYLAGKGLDNIGTPDEQSRAQHQSMGRLQAEQ